MIVVALAVVPNFDSPLTVTYLLRDVAPILLIALPMTLIIITEEIDLSVASIVGLSSVMTGILTEAGWPFAAAAVAAILVGAVAGAINGFLVTVVGLPSLAVTIGTLALFRGIAVGLLGTTAITDFPEFWTDLAKANIPGTPIPVIMIPFVVLAIVFAVLLHFTPFGRSLYAIGLNKEAAAFSGIDVGRTKFLLFVLSGTVAGLRRRLLHAAVQQRARRQRHRHGALRSSRPCSSAASRSSAAAARCTASSPACCSSARSAARCASPASQSDIINVITGVLLMLSVVSASLLAWLRRKRISAIGKKKGRSATSAERALTLPPAITVRSPAP